MGASCGAGACGGGAGVDGPAGAGAGLAGRVGRWGAGGVVGGSEGGGGVGEAAGGGVGEAKGAVVGVASGAADGWGACSEVVVTAGAGSGGVGLATRLFRHDDSETTSTTASVKTLGKLRRPWRGGNVKSHQSRKTRYHGSLPFPENAAGTWCLCRAR